VERVADRPHVAVVGAGEGSSADAVALDVGAQLALGGAVIVTGGLGGVMEAACRGAKEAGGTTVGILPGSNRRAANPYVDVAIATGMGELRNGLVVRCADAVVAVGGGFGTLSEIGFALKAGKRVVGLGTWSVDRRDGGDATAAGIVVAANPHEAARLALEAAAATG
jgi:uncharacterized protein (TIGR00725 family)